MNPLDEVAVRVDQGKAAVGGKVLPGEDFPSSVDSADPSLSDDVQMGAGPPA